MRPADRPDIPAGRAMGKCEAPRGELVYFLKTNGADEPERVKWRVPSFPNWDALTFMLQGREDRRHRHHRQQHRSRACPARSADTRAAALRGARRRQ